MSPEKIVHLVFLLTSCSGVIIIGLIFKILKSLFKLHKLSSSHLFLLSLIILFILKIIIGINFNIIFWGFIGLVIGVGIVSFFFFEEGLKK